MAAAWVGCDCANRRQVISPNPAVTGWSLLVLCRQVEYVEETHPPNRELLNKLLAAVDKRDKYRFFGKPVTDEQVCVRL